MDEVELSSNVSPSNTIKLSLANHVDSFVSPESSLNAPIVLEVLAGFDSPSDKSMILLHYVLKVLYGLSFDECFALLVEREYLRRQNLRVERRLKQARLPITAAVEDLDFKRPRGLSKTQVLDWSQGQWVHDH